MSKIIQKRENAETRRKEIIDAARKLIIRYGIEKLTLKRVAIELGISEAAIYRHFKNKRDVLFLLVDHIEENLMGDVERGRANIDNHNNLEIIENIFKSHMSGTEQRKGISYLVIAEIISLGDKKLNERVTNILNKYMGCIKDVILEGIKCGEIRENLDLETAVMVYFGMIQGLISVWALSDHSFRLDQKYIPMWDFFREAIIKR